MADKIITVDVQTQNLKEALIAAKELNAELDKIGKPRSATRTGSRAADAALGISGGSDDKGLRRGSSGAGGRGDERDFARQAQGLGGLVHVYATFAANIYAVTAAFSALSRAQDSVNMVAAADTLSSRYGVALKGVGQELQKITGYAISANEALSFASLGASAGVTSGQMQNLAKVATGASKALGRDLTDAMQRIYRGAIKVEPELLDELGLMVKVDEASKNYARSLNKTALQLTDVEKRQGFVNAVIEQGNRKFSDAADIAANPYSKLLASMQNTSTAGLSLVNKVLSPIVDLLSQSPTALVSVAALLVGKLAKMAMPDLLPKAEEQFKKVNAQLELASANFKKANKGILKEFESTSAYKLISADDQTTLVKKAATIGKGLKDALAADIETSTGKGPIKLSLDTENLRKQYEKALNSAIATAEKQQATAKKDSTKVEKATLIAQLKLERDLVRELEGGFAKLADAEKLGAEAKAAENIATINSLRAQNQLKIVALQHEGKHLAAIRESYLAQKAITLELQKQNSQQGGSKVASTWIGFTGGVKGVASAAMTAGSSLLGMLGTIGMVVGGAAMLGQALYAAGTHFKLFTNAADKANEALDSLNTIVDTLKISTTKLNTAGSFADIFEFKQGNLKLLSEASDKLKELTTNYINFQLNATRGDKILDGIKKYTPFMTSVDQGYSKGVANAANTMSKSGLDLTEFKKSLVTEMTKLSPNRNKDVEARRYNELPLEDLINLAIKFKGESKGVSDEVDNLISKLEEQGKVSASAAAKMEQVSISVKELGNVSKDFVNKLIPQTELGKLQNQVSQGFMGALENPEAILKFIKALDVELDAIANTDVSSTLIGTKEAFSQLEKTLQADMLAAGSDAKAKEAASTKFKEATKALVTNNNVMGLVTKGVLDITEATYNLGTAAISAEKKIANINRSLKVLSSVESITGATPAMEKQKMALENKLISVEREALQTQLDQVSRIAKARADMASSATGVNASDLLGERGIQNIRSKYIETSNMPDSQAKTDKLRELMGMYQAISDATIAQTNLRGKLDILEAKRVTTLQAQLRLDEAIAAANLKGSSYTQEKLAYELALEREQSAMLASVAPGLENQLAYSILRKESTQASEELEAKLIVLRKVRAELSRIGGSKEVSPSIKADMEKYGINDRNIDRILESAEKSKEWLDTSNRIKYKTQEITEAQSLNVAKLKIVNSLQSLGVELTNSEVISLEDRYKVTKLIGKAEAQTYQLKIQSINSEIEKKKVILDELVSKGLIKDTTQYTLDLQDLQIQKQQLSLELENKKLQRQKETNEAFMKLFEMGKGGSFADYTKAAGEDFVAKMREALKTAKSATSTLNDGIMSSVDATIDEYTTAMMKGNVNIKELGTFARNQLATAFQQAAAQQMKNMWKSTFDTLLGSKTTVNPVVESNTYLASIDNTLKSLSVGGGFTGQNNTYTPTQGWLGDTPKLSTVSFNNPEDTLKDAASISDTAATTQALAATDNAKASDSFIKASDTSFLASEALLLFTGQWKQAALMFLMKLGTTLMASAGSSGSSSGGGFLDIILKGVVGYATGGWGGAIAGVAGGAAGGTSGGAENAVSGSAFANGGIMTDYGPLKLNKYSKGGIADSPQLALFGEGKRNEAYVPLPDNRSIPVTLSGNTSSGGVSIGDTNINITIDSAGNANMTNDQQTQVGKMLASSVKKTVQEELIKQSRPGGMFYGGKK